MNAADTERMNSLEEQLAQAALTCRLLDRINRYGRGTAIKIARAVDLAYDGIGVYPNEEELQRAQRTSMLPRIKLLATDDMLAAANYHDLPGRRGHLNAGDHPAILDRFARFVREGWLLPPKRRKGAYAPAPDIRDGIRTLGDETGAIARELSPLRHQKIEEERAARQERMDARQRELDARAQREHGMTYAEYEAAQRAAECDRCSLKPGESAEGPCDSSVEPGDPEYSVCGQCGQCTCDYHYA